MAYYTFTSVLLLCSILLITECWCLTVKLTIPEAVRRGDRVVLKCDYDLEGDPLYSVTWYQGEREFYRYIPGEDPPRRRFPIPGLEAPQTECSETTVVFNNVSMVNGGPYTCEVVADAPSFYTEMQSGELRVVEIWKRDPVINELKERYRQGDVLKLECISESRPAANITWIVNGVLVKDAMITHHSRPSENGTLLNSHSALSLEITPQLCIKGRVYIRCIASMYDFYFTSTETSVELEGPCQDASATPPPTTNREVAESLPRSTVTLTALNNWVVARCGRCWGWRCCFDRLGEILKN